jgi:hypothetical protein
MLATRSRRPVSADSGVLPPAYLHGRILTRPAEQSDVFLETKEMPRLISMMIYDFYLLHFYHLFTSVTRKAPMMVHWTILVASSVTTYERQQDL